MGEMNVSAGDELLQLADRMSAVSSRADEASFKTPLDELLSAAEEIGRAWSNSNVGFHADIYYQGLVPAPPGAHFSPEWGFNRMFFEGTKGDWVEYPRDVVFDRIDELSGRVDLSQIEADATEADEVFEDARDNALSLLNTYLRTDDDQHLRAIVGKISKLKVLSHREALKPMLRQPPFTRDTTAATQGLRSAPHQEALARVLSLRSPFMAARRLSSLCRNAARHFERIGGVSAPTRSTHHTGRIVIGHGQSPLWAQLKDFIADRLGLEWDEFNRVSTAGVATVDRLQQMLDTAAFAFLVATAEDETAEGGKTARQNVVHEIGLFQARLGIGRAIVLLEEGCQEFSNIHGLGQIRFPSGQIKAAFEDVRMVLEREGLV